MCHRFAVQLHLRIFYRLRSAIYKKLAIRAVPGAGPLDENAPARRAGRCAKNSCSATIFNIRKMLFNIVLAHY